MCVKKCNFRDELSLHRPAFARFGGGRKPGLKPCVGWRMVRCSTILCWAVIECRKSIPIVANLPCRTARGQAETDRESACQRRRDEFVMTEDNNPQHGNAVREPEAVERAEMHAATASIESPASAPAEAGSEPAASESSPLGAYRRARLNPTVDLGQAK